MEEKWPVLGRHARASEWLRVWADLGRAPRTIEAYARGLAEYLQVCERDGADPLSATRAHVAGYVAFYQGDPDLAISELSKADQADPFILGLLAQAYEQKKDQARARELYAKIISQSTHSLQMAFARPLAGRRLAGTQ